MLRDKTKFDKYYIPYPRQVLIEITQECNLMCVMCSRAHTNPIHYKDKFMSNEIFAGALNAVEKAEYVGLHGFGEALLDKRLGEMIRQIKEKNPRAYVATTTNGMLLNEEKGRMLIEAGLDEVQVSIDGTRSNAEIRGIKLKVLENNIKGLERLKKEIGSRTPIVTFTMAIMKRNIMELPELLEFASLFDVKKVELKPLQVFWKTLREENIYRYRDEAVRIIRKSIEKAENLGIKLTFFSMDAEMSDKRRSCPFLSSYMFISYNGDVSLCCEGIDTGENVKNVLNFDIFNSKAYLKLRRQMGIGRFKYQCRTCPHIQNTVANQERYVNREYKIRMLLHNIFPKYIPHLMFKLRKEGVLKTFKALIFWARKTLSN